MNPWDIASTIAIILTPIVIGIGFFFAHRQLVSNRNTRMAQLVMAITTRWDNQETSESRFKVSQLDKNLGQAIREADAGNKEELYSLLIVADFFDVLGLLVIEGYLNCSMAYDLYGAAEEKYYNLYRSAIDEPKFMKSYRYFQRLDDIFKREAAKRSTEKPKIAT